jgi:hypothetical protein
MFAKLEGKEYTFTCEKKTNCRTYLETNTAISLEHIMRCQSLRSEELDYELQQLISNSTIQETLSLKVGAMVMCTVNLDVDQGICNGSQGIISEIIEGERGVAVPVVRFSNGVSKTILPHFRQSEEFPVVAVGQIPLCLAWALTIHKIQGATLSVAEIDVGGQIFEFGQTYVALSRVQSLEGLYLSAFHPQRIRANDHVRAFYAEFPAIDYLSKIETTPKTSENQSSNPFASYELKEEGFVQAEDSTKTAPKTSLEKSSKKNHREPTQQISLDLFIQGKSVSEIAVLRSLKEGTIWEHILGQLPNPAISTDRFMSKAEYDEMKGVFCTLRDASCASPVSVKQMKEYVGLAITCEQVKAFLRMECTGHTQENANMVIIEPVSTTKTVRLY